MERSVERPVGITILAVLALIGGAFALLGALGSFAGGAMVGSMGAQGSAMQSAMQSSMANAVAAGTMTAEQAAQATAQAQTLTTGGGAAVGGLFMLIGIVLLLQGALSIAFGVGALQLKPWAWMLGIVAYGLGILVNIAQAINGSFGLGTIIGLAIGGGILYYLFTPEVRRAFGQENNAMFGAKSV